MRPMPRITPLPPRARAIPRVFRPIIPFMNPRASGHVHVIRTVIPVHCALHMVGVEFIRMHGTTLQESSGFRSDVQPGGYKTRSMNILLILRLVAPIHTPQPFLRLIDGSGVMFLPLLVYDVIPAPIPVNLRGHSVTCAPKPDPCHVPPHW